MPDYTVVVLDGAFPSAVTATLDILDTSRRLAPPLGITPPTWRVCSPTAGRIELRHSLHLDVEPLPTSEPLDRSCWIVVGMGTDSARTVRRRLDDTDVTELAERLARHARRHGQVAAACASVFVLARAGLLGGRRATTTWWLAPHLQALEPTCSVEAERMVCADRGVTTAGAAFAQTDLLLHLLRESHGRELSGAVARMLLLDARTAQAPYVIPEVLADGNASVARFIAAIESDFVAPLSIPAIAADLGISERTLARRIKSATGHTPLGLATTVRVRRAAALLSETELTVEQVARMVGYQDSTALRRTMRRTLGVLPSALRT